MPPLIGEKYPGLSMKILPYLPSNWNLWLCWLSDWIFDWRTSRQTDWYTGWLTDWLVGREIPERWVCPGRSPSPSSPPRQKSMAAATGWQKMLPMISEYEPSENGLLLLQWVGDDTGWNAGDGYDDPVRSEHWHCWIKRLWSNINDPQFNSQHLLN